MLIFTMLQMRSFSGTFIALEFLGDIIYLF